MEPADRGDVKDKAAPVGRLRFYARCVRERSRPQGVGRHQRAIERIVFTRISSQGGAMTVKRDRTQAHVEVTQGLRRRHPPVTAPGDTPFVTRGMTEANHIASSRRPAADGAHARSRVLVIEDERDVAELMRYHLARDGYEVRLCSSGIEGLGQARESRPDMVLLDIMVPELNGWEVCRRLKQDRDLRGIPVIMVTGRVEEGDKVLGFEMGADDYVTKPFSPRELLARVRAVMRRSKPAATDGKKTHLKIGQLEIDRHRFEVTMTGRRVELTPKEFELLAALAGTPGRVFGREELLDLVWGQDEFVEPRTVDVHVARLRAKFSAHGLPVPGIETVRGVGYRFREPD